ncbi:ribonuclease H-like domain, reverse transcriptase, RNA-dependent DNA polymerase [Tanacetum coccineum]
MKAVKEKEQLQKTVDSWKNSSKNLWKLVDSGMTSNSKVGLGYEIQSNNEVLSYEEEMNRTVFKCTEEDFLNKPLYSRFSKTNNFKGVPHPLYGDYTPKPQEEIDDSFEGSFGNPSEHSSESESESISVPNEMSTSKSVTTNEKVVSESKEVEPSCATHVKTPRQPMKNQGTPKVKGKNWNEMMERELGEGYSFIKKKCFVCGSLSHLIRDCDFYEKKMAREAELKKQRVFNTGNGVAKPVWNNANRVNRANHFIPRPVQLNTVRQNVNSVRPNVNTGRANVNSVKSNVNSVRHNVNSVRTNVNTMPDENQILLQVPRQHNMYNFDMKTPSLIKDYACLIAKATSDESKLWHMSACTLQPNANAFEEQDAADELIVVPTAIKHTAAKVGPRMSSTNSKADEFLTELQNFKPKVAVCPIPTLRIHNIHPQSQILGDPKSSVQTRSRVQKHSGAHALEEPKKISEALKYDSWVKAMQEEFITFWLATMYGFFVDLPLESKGHRTGRDINYDEVFAPLWQEYSYQVVKALYGLHQAPRAWYATLSTFLEKHGYRRGTIDKTLFIKKDKKDIMLVQVFQMSSMGELIFFLGLQVKQKTDGIFISQRQVTPKTSHLNAVKRIFKYLKGKPNLGLWYPRESSFDLEAFSDILWIQNQMLDYGFNFMNTKIHIDNESTICIVKNPVYHSKTKHIEIRHHFIRDSYEKKLIRVEKIHTDFNVADLLTKAFDGPRFKSGRPMLILLIITKNHNRSTTMAFVPKHNQVGFLKKPEGSAGFEQIVDFLKGTHIRYALEHNPTIYVSVIKQFWQTVTVITLDNGEQELKATIDTHEYIISESSVRNKLKLADENGITEFTNAEIFEGMANLGSKSGGWDQFGSKLATALICLSTGRTYNFSKMIFEAMVANDMMKTKVNHKKSLLITHTGISATIASEPTPVAEPTTHHTSPSPEPDNEHTEHIFEQPSPEHQPLSPRQETEVPQSQDPTHPHVPEARTMTVEDLLHLVPNLIKKVDSLETELKQTKLTMGKAIVKLVKKVKKMEDILKRRHVVFTDSEDEEPEDQGRIILDIDDDPLGSKGDFVTPTKPSGEAQEEEISPTTLEAAKTLSKVASQRSKSVDKGKRYKRRKESKGKDIDSGFEDISTGFEELLRL